MKRTVMIMNQMKIIFHQKRQRINHALVTRTSLR